MAVNGLYVAITNMFNQQNTVMEVIKGTLIATIKCGVIRTEDGKLIRFLAQPDPDLQGEQMEIEVSPVSLNGWNFDHIPVRKDNQTGQYEYVDHPRHFMDTLRTIWHDYKLL